MTPAVVERPNLSLFGIKPELIELIEFREELLSDSELVGEEREASLKATDERIREYVTAEINNAGIALYLREFETREEFEKEEAERHQLKRRRWADRYERLKMLIMAFMLQTNQPRIEGPAYTLSLRKIAASVDVAQPSYVPTELKRVNIQMNFALWGEIQAAAVMGRPIGKEAAAKILADTKVYEPEPNKIDILSLLKSQVKCGKCDGKTEGCNACGGSGKVAGAVPGCRLVQDKTTLVIK